MESSFVTMFLLAEGRTEEVGLDCVQFQIIGHWKN